MLKVLPHKVVQGFFRSRFAFSVLLRLGGLKLIRATFLKEISKKLGCCMFYIHIYIYIYMYISWNWSSRDPNIKKWPHALFVAIMLWQCRRIFEAGAYQESFLK